MSDTEPNDGGTAFPATVPGMSCTTAGLSKREWFAGMALSGIWAGRESDFVKISAPNTMDVAVACYAIADAMLKVGEQ
jgi:hypothetical protein